MSSSNYDFARILAILGGIILIVEPIVNLISHAHFSGGIIVGIIAGIIVLISTGTIKSRHNISFDGVTLIVIAVVVFIFGGSTLGGVLVVIAGILLVI
jgi:putative intracellular protease/amidase